MIERQTYPKARNEAKKHELYVAILGWHFCVFYLVRS